MIPTQFISRSIAGALLALGLGMTAQVQAESTAALDVEVHGTISAFEKEQSHAKAILNHAKGALICPKMRKGGIFGIGAGRGHCTLLIDGKTDSYYNYTAAKAGFFFLATNQTP
jgi:lipid-binding SYLF domain-containing protein